MSSNGDYFPETWGRWLLPGDLAEDAGELVGAGGAAAGAVDAGEALQGEFHGGILQKGAERLQVAVAAAKLMKVVDTAVYEVEIYEFRAHQGARCRRDVPHTVLDGIHHYLKIVSFHIVILFSGACVPWKLCHPRQHKREGAL